MRLGVAANGELNLGRLGKLEALHLAQNLAEQLFGVATGRRGAGQGNAFAEAGGVGEDARDEKLAAEGFGLELGEMPEVAGGEFEVAGDVRRRIRAGLVGGEERPDEAGFVERDGVKMKLAVAQGGPVHAERDLGDGHLDGARGISAGDDDILADDATKPAQAQGLELQFKPCSRSSATTRRLANSGRPTRSR